jgi:hypothetical protein
MKISKKQSVTKTVAQSLPTSGSSSSESEDELEETPILSATPDPVARVTKKRRANEEGVAIATATTATVLASNTQGGKAVRKPNVPFQRVKTDMAKNHGESLRDNSFGSRVRPVSRVPDEKHF